jgi:hypothetical protein
MRRALELCCGFAGTAFARRFNGSAPFFDDRVELALCLASRTWKSFSHAKASVDIEGHRHRNALPRWTDNTAAFQASRCEIKLKS